jgi:hypothetical protein
MAASLCSGGWHESLGIMMLVVVGYLCMSKDRILSRTVVSRNCNVEKAYLVFSFSFYGKLHSWHCGVEAVDNVVYIG